MLNIKIQERIRNTNNRKRTRVADIAELDTKANLKWAGPIARMKDNERTIRSREWQITKGVRIRCKAETALERQRCGATRISVDKDSKGQRTLEDWRRATSRC